MKKFIKNNLFGFILGIIVSCGVVYAATLLDSKDVTYNANDNSFEASNVESALNVLYNKIYNRKIKSDSAQSMGGTDSTVTMQLEKGKWKVLVWPFRIATYYEVYNGMDTGNTFSLTGGTYTAAADTMGAPLAYDVIITDATGTATFVKQLAGYKSTAAVMFAVEQ